MPGGVFREDRSWPQRFLPCVRTVVDATAMSMWRATPDGWTASFGIDVGHRDYGRGATRDRAAGDQLEVEHEQRSPGRGGRERAEAGESAAGFQTTREALPGPCGRS